MKRAAGFVLAAIFLASRGYPLSYYALELRGGSRIFAVDQPLRKGSVVLFHRYPDGIYMSLAASEVEKVVSMEGPPKAEKLAPGEAVYIGTALAGPSYEAPPGASLAPPQYSMGGDSGYGYYGGYWGGGGGYAPPAGPRPPASPSRIGPNGYPILAPPGSPGSAPPRIGPNGYPILAPQAPVPAPRQRPQ